MRGDILLALLVIGWAGIDMSVSLPSLWLYIKSLGGTKSDYGLAGAIANAVSFVTAPLFGWMSDRFSSKVIVVVSLLIQALGGLIYAFAALAEHPAECSAAGAGSDSCENTLDDDKVWAGPYVVIVGRFVIGKRSYFLVCFCATVREIRNFNRENCGTDRESVPLQGWPPETSRLAGLT
eukprot:SAG31_NODE_198_length_20656_cov_5.167291_19_plen_179_part_00